MYSIVNQAGERVFRSVLAKASLAAFFREAALFAPTSLFGELSLPLTFASWKMPLLQVSQRQPDGSPVLEEGENVIRSEPNVALFFDVERSEGVGSLFITSKHVIWLSAEDQAKGFSMDYYFISIHALSTDTSSFPHSCIYCQLESEETPEARLVPQQTDHCTYFNDSDRSLLTYFASQYKASTTHFAMEQS